MIRKIRVLVLAAMMALALAAAFGQNAAAAPAAQAFPETRQAESGRFTITGQIQSGGTTINMVGDGAYARDAFQMRLDMTGPAIGGAPSTIGIEFRLVNNVYYFKLAGLGGEAGEDQWYSMDLASMGGALPGMVPGMTPGGMVPGQTGTNPGAIDPRLMEAFTVSLVGRERTITGVDATKFMVDVDIRKLMEATGQDTQGVQYSEDFKYVMHIWVGDDQYLHQMDLTMDGAVISGGTATPVSMNMTIAFTDFNAPITVMAPENAEPLNLGTLPGFPGTGGPIPGMPTAPPGGVVPTGGGQAPGMPRTGGGDQLIPLALLGLGLLSLASGVLVRRRALAA